MRQVLLSLVVREAAQEDAFLRRFDRFFAEAPAPPVDLDTPRLVAELRRQGEAGQKPRKPPRPSRARWLAIATAAAVMVAAGIGWWLSRPTGPAASLEPAWLAFQEGGQAREVTLESSGGSPLYTWSQRIMGPHAGDFEIGTETCSERTLEPGESCRIEVSFQPTEEGLREAWLQLESNAHEAPWVVFLRAGRAEIPAPTEERTVTIPVLTAEEISLHGPDWRNSALWGTLCLLAFLADGAYLLWRRRPPHDAPPPATDPSLPRLFDPGTIGGAPEPRLDDETLDVLADSLGYYRSEAPSRHLDVAASVAATGKSGGLPQLVFQRRRQVRRVVILEDADADALDWNPMPGELAAGLSRRGIPVLHGRFHGVPGRSRTAEGEVHLEDLEDDLGNLLLIFSDGKGLRRDRHRFVLDALGHWPMAAWLEPREPRTWDAATALPAAFGVPVFPATPGGLLRALGRFLTERSPQAEAPDPGSWRGLPPRRATTATAVQVEAQFGDALLWAQAVAMTMPPASLGLADTLRRRFHPNLPPERIERLVALPGTTLEAGGLRFTPPILAVLRRGFVVRRDRRQQEEVLEFLLEKIQEVEPVDRNSAGHRAWEWRLERVRLELDPDRALRRLSQLAAGSLGDSIRGELANAALSDHAGSSAAEAAVVPLRARPTKRRGLQRLLLLNERSGVRRAEAQPAIGRLQWAVLTVLALGSLGLLGFAGLDYQTARVSRFLTFAGPEVAELTPRIRVAGGDWRDVGPEPRLNSGVEYRLVLLEDGITSTQAISLDTDVEYRLALLEDGMTSTLTIPADSASRRLSLGSTTRPCEENQPDIGLGIARCSPADAPVPSWRAAVNASGGADSAPDRRLSVGLEVDFSVNPRATDQAAEGLVSLLATRSVDLIFQLSIGTNGGFHFEEAAAIIENEIGAWLPEAQLVWWTIYDRRRATQSEAFAPVRELIDGLTAPCFSSTPPAPRKPIARSRASWTRSKALYSWSRSSPGSFAPHPRPEATAIRSSWSRTPARRRRKTRRRTGPKGGSTLWHQSLRCFGRVSWTRRSVATRSWRRSVLSPTRPNGSIHIWPRPWKPSPTTTGRLPMTCSRRSRYPSSSCPRPTITSHFIGSSPPS